MVLFTFALYINHFLSRFYTLLYVIFYMQDSFSLHPEKKGTCIYNPKSDKNQELISLEHSNVIFKSLLNNHTKHLFLPNAQC